MAIYSLTGTPLSSAYDVTSQPLGYAYDLVGTVVFSAGSVDYADYTIEQMYNSHVANMQGFDIFNGVIFQFRASSSVDNTMVTLNAETGAILANNISAKSDHGDSASFSNEYYSQSDVYPLLYVTADTNPPKVYKNRVTPISSELIATYTFSLNEAGFYAAHAYDYENHILYLVGYTQQNYLSDNGGANETIISKWDMTNLTDNGDGSYTPAFISNYTRPFIYCMQGQQYHDGMLWIASGYGSARSYVYALNPANGNLLYTIDTGVNVEIEGVAFISDTEMIFNLQGGVYKKVTFATISSPTPYY